MVGDLLVAAGDQQALQGRRDTRSKRDSKCNFARRQPTRCTPWYERPLQRNELVCGGAQVFWNLIAQLEEHFAAMDLVDKTAFPFPYAQVSHA